MADILLVEDDNSLRAAYSMILSAQKHTVVSAVNGEDALKKLKTFKPKIILLDLLMPIMSGLEFLKKYDAKKFPDTDVLMLTNMPSSPEIDQCLKLGAKSVSVKSSMTPANLLTLIDENLKK